jgi:CSLREA domain-containing protein
MMLAAQPRTTSRRRGAIGAKTVVATSAVLLASAALAQAATITPNTLTDETDPGGTCSLREAVASANLNSDRGGCTHTGAYGTDTIKLGGGDYKLTIRDSPEDANTSGDLDVTDPLTITGLGRTKTRIDGTAVNSPDRVIQVLNFASLSLNGLNVHGGQPGFSGGGIKGDGGTTIRLTDSAVSGNTAGVGGGGIAGQLVILTDSKVSGNTAIDGSGGGIAAGTLDATDSTVSGNTAAPSGGYGGGISAGTVNLTDSVVTGNHGVIGGGLLSNGGTVNQSVFSGNTGGYGAGIILFNNELKLTQSTISGNHASGNGGGIYVDSGTLELTDTTLAGNTSQAYGGGLSIGGGAANLASSTITRNIANSDNSGGENGGGLDRSAGTVTLRNTILAGNLDPGGAPFPDWNCNGGVTSKGYNLIGSTDGCSVTAATGDQRGTNASPLDPKLATLAENGGRTRTAVLLGSSPAINVANPATPGSGGSACPASDQRGATRTLGGRCDVGAYERVSCQGHLVNVVGTATADSLIGSSGADGILGLGGNDRLAGGSGNDGLCGGDGNDRLHGGAGTDSCDGGSGTDSAIACEATKNVP